METARSKMSNRVNQSWEGRIIMNVYFIPPLSMIMKQAVRFQTSEVQVRADDTGMSIDRDSDSHPTTTPVHKALDIIIFF
jgi:hypothetical protein